MKMMKMLSGTEVSGLHIAKGASGPRAVEDGERCDRRRGATKCISSLYSSLFRNQGDAEPGITVWGTGFLASQGPFRI